MKLATLAFVLVVATPTLARAEGDPELPPVERSEDEPEVEQPGWFQGRRGFSAKLGAGLGYRQIGAFPLLGADMELALGSQTRSGGWYGLAGVLLGRTIGGLNMRQIRVGASWEAPFDRWHLGIGPSFSYLAFERVSTEAVIDGLTAGPFAFASYDLTDGEHAALAVSLKAAADVHDSDAVLFGATLGLGGRFR